MCTIMCPKCHKIRRGTKHHVLPKRHFKHQKNAPILFICRLCHDQLELLIPFKKKQRDFYINVVKTFLGGDEAKWQ